MPTTDPTMQTAARTFFSSPRIAVAGASSNPSKFGHQIFAWYLSHRITPIAVNPSNSSINVRGRDFDTIASVSQLQEPGKRREMRALRRCGYSLGVLGRMSWLMLRRSFLVLRLVGSEMGHGVERDGVCWLTERRR
jgi:hypothetical protein